MMLHCDVCHARKKIVGLGNLQIDCPNCKGIGWVEIPEQKPVERITLQDAPIINKRGRKKKIEPVLHCE